MNYPMYLAFLKWCFVKIFGGTFDTLQRFRYQLKQGAPDSIFALFGFVLVSLLIVGVVTLLSAAFISDHATVRTIGASMFYTACFTLVYNIVRAAFECFLEEREELIERLKQ